MRNPILRKTLGAAAAVLLACAQALPAAAADRVPNDTYYSEQWYLKHIGVPEAWNRTLGLETVTVAVIDSGVDIDHPDLKDDVWTNVREIPGNGIDDDGNGFVDDVHGWDFVNGDADPRPDVSGDFSVLGANHGTINAGIIAARGDNGKGIVGVTWQSTIMPIRALDSNGQGEPWKVARAVDYAVANGAKVITLSFAGAAKSAELAAALRRAYDAGVFIVAAAGNAPDGGDAVDLDANPLYPICLDQGSDENFVFGVAATDDHDKKTDFSNYGAGCVDIAAPGTRVLSTQLWRPKSKYFDSPYGGFYNGTSVAAPIVAGVAALVRSLDKNLTPKQVANILTASAANVDAQNPGYFGKIGRGRIDAAKAVDMVMAMLKGGGESPVTTASLAPGAAGRYVVAAAGAGRKAEVRMFTADGTFIRSFNAFPDGFRGGSSLALADFDRTGRQSIVVGALAGGAPQVRVFDVNTKAIGGFLAYDAGFRGGVDVATADLDGDGKDEIVTGAGPGGGPQVRFFAPDGTPKGGFFAFDAKRRTGVRVAAGDLDGDGKAEIVAWSPDGSAVRVFGPKGDLRGEFFPFGKGGKGTIEVAVGQAAGKAAIVIRKFSRAGVRMAAYAMRGDALADDGAIPGTFGAPAGYAPEVSTAAGTGARFGFLAFEPKFKGGIRAAMTGRP